MLTICGPDTVDDKFSTCTKAENEGGMKVDPIISSPYLDQRHLGRHLYGHPYISNLLLVTPILKTRACRICNTRHVKAPHPLICLPYSTAVSLRDASVLTAYHEGMLCAPRSDGYYGGTRNRHLPGGACRANYDTFVFHSRLPTTALRHSQFHEYNNTYLTHEHVSHSLAVHMMP